MTNERSPTFEVRQRRLFSVQEDDAKAHVATRFVRLREDGTVIKTFESLYVMTLEGGRWGIRGRSSFAP